MSYEFKRARGKTAVYSGTRQHSTFVPKLEDLCIQTLLNHAGRIEDVGEVPFYILRPLLNKLPVHHLRRIEAHSKYLREDEDSDEPWKLHCQRAFAGRKPKEGQTWRGLYKACEEERDNHLRKVAKRIKKKELKKAAPTRQTRIVEQQLPVGKNHAISSSTVITKTIRNHLPSSSSSQRSLSNPPGSGSGTRLKDSQGSSTTVVIRRDINANGSQSKTKVQKAPLMQKSMQLFKSRFRR